MKLPISLSAVSVLSNVASSSGLGGKAVSKLTALHGVYAQAKDSVETTFNEGVDEVRARYHEVLDPVDDRINRAMSLVVMLGGTEQGSPERADTADQLADVVTEIKEIAPDVIEQVAAVADADDNVPTADVDATDEPDGVVVADDGIDAAVDAAKGA